MNWTDIILKILTIYPLVAVLYLMATTGLLSGENKLRLLKNREYWNHVKWDFIFGFLSTITLVLMSEVPYFLLIVVFNIIVMLIFILILPIKKINFGVIGKLNEINKIILLNFYSFIVMPYFYFRKTEK